MPRYLIIPSDQAFSSAQVIAPNPAGVFLMVQRLECKEADVERDGQYCFSLRLADNGLWTIFQRVGLDRGETVPAFG